MNKYKIVIDARMVESSGIGTYLQYHLRFMIDDLRFKTILIGNKRRLEEIFKGKGVEIINCDSKIYSIEEQIDLITDIPECDLFWAPHYNIPLFYRGKMIVTIHDICHVAMPEFFPGFLRQKYAKYVIGKAIKKSCVILTDSEFTLSELQKHFQVDKNKVKVIKLGVSNIYNNEKSADWKILEEHKISNPYLLYVGNIKPHKNIERLIKAFGIINKKIPVKMDFVFVGKKEGFITGVDGLEEILGKEELNNVYFIDKQIDENNLKILYQNASCFAFPSLYEGFGLPPLEAMACGCPVVASKAASLPEVCGDAAYYVDPYDVNSIADGIYNVLIDDRLRNTLIQKGLERAKLFDWKKTAEQTMEVIEETLND